MNDRELIWEAYTSKQQLDDIIYPEEGPTGTVELTKEELINILKQEGGFSYSAFNSSEPIENLIKFWESEKSIIQQGQPVPKDRSHIIRTNKGTYIIDYKAYSTFLDNSYIKLSLQIYRNKLKESNRLREEMEKFNERERKFPQLFRHLDADELAPNQEPSPQILYHAGTKILKVKDIEFDRGALGFHLGTKEQMEYISKGTYKRDSGLSHRQMQQGGRLKISKFLVSPVCTGGKYILRIDTDMPWEDPVQLSVYLNYVGLLNREDVEHALDVFGYVDNRDMEEDIGDDYDLGNILYTVLDKIQRFGFDSDEYHPADDLPIITEHSEFYKDKQALGFIRNLLVEQGYAGIIYENVGEGTHVTSEESQYSLCILDKCILKDVK